MLHNAELADPVIDMDPGVPQGIGRHKPLIVVAAVSFVYHSHAVCLNDSEAFIEEAVKMFHVMKPFNDYLNKALDGFRMPTR